MTSCNLLDRIDLLRKELELKVEQIGSIKHPEVLAKSQQLDLLIIAYYNMKQSE